MKVATPVRALALALVASALVAGAATGAPAAVSAHAGCNPQARLAFDVSAAAAVPAVKGDQATQVGSDAAGFASSLQPQVNACSGTPSPGVARGLAAVSRQLAAGHRAQAQAALKQLLVDVAKASRKNAVAHAPRVEHALRSTGCPDQAPHINLRSVKGVADNLAIAQKALQAGDPATADNALAAARAALSTFAQDASNGASTVGDWLAIARAGEQLGVGKVVTYAQGRARNRAAADVATAAKADPCTVKLDDFRCFTRMLVTAQLVGASIPDALASGQSLSKGIEDRLHNKAPQGCEEWTVTATATQVMQNTGDTWTIKWAAGKFRVNRATGELDGSYEAGYIPDGGWPGIIGNATDACIEDLGDGPVNMGPATITGGGFHYKISGSVSDQEIDLTLSSDDAAVTVTAPPDPGCQFLADLGQGFIDSFLRSGIPLLFTVSPNQDTATFQYSDEGASMTATITRTPIKKP